MSESATCRKSTIIATIFIAFVYLIFVPLVYAATEYKMTDCWSFKEGAWWEFNDGKIEITGTEEIDGISTFKFLDTSSCSGEDAEEINVVNDDANGFVFFLPSEDGSYSIANISDPYVKKGDKTTSSFKDSDGEQVTLVFKLDGTANVVLPAGKFKRCLRFSVKVEVVDTDGNDSYTEKFYLAKGVGLVKVVRVKQSTDEAGCAFGPESFDVFNGIRELENYSN